MRLSITVCGEITGAAFFMLVNETGKTTAAFSVTSAAVTTGDRSFKRLFPQIT